MLNKSKKFENSIRFEDSLLNTMENTIKSSTEKNKIRKNELINAAALPVLFTIILWVIEIGAEISGLRMIKFGIHPHTAEGLLGILTAPLIHADIDHLLSNTAPLLIVGTGMIYFYKELAYKVFILVWLMSGSWVWLFAREEYHIGASGLIYGFVFFLFFSGVFRKDTRLLAVSLLVTFLYGSLVWGILPVNQYISWEGHLFGSLAGILCAFYYRAEGPIKPKPQWLIDEEAGEILVELEEDIDRKQLTATDNEQYIIKYDYVEKKNSEQSKNNLDKNIKEDDENI